MKNILYKRMLVFAAVVLCFLAICIPSTVSLNIENKFNFLKQQNSLENINGNVWIVDDEPGDGDFTDIQPAIDNSNSGDIIHVYSGNYTKFIIKEKSNLTILGLKLEYPDMTLAPRPIIHGDYKGSVIRIEESEKIRIEGFKICFSEYTSNMGGIYIWQGWNCVISDNIISQCWYGIYLYESSNIAIWQNQIYSNKNGIKIENPNPFHPNDFNYISMNHIYYNLQNGVITQNAKKIIILRNNIYDNNYCGIHIYFNSIDISLEWSFISQNNIKNNNESCLNLKTFSTLWFNNYITKEKVRILNIEKDVFGARNLFPAKKEFFIPTADVP